MRTPSTVDQFLELVSKSGLVDPQALQAYLQRRQAAGERSGTPRALAGALVRDGLLTRFQSEQLLAGKWRNFILSGKYKVLGPLGAGGMGHVYLCEHQIMRRRVAVKVLPLRSGDASALERFHREARAVAQLKHNNIVGGYDVDRDGKLHFLVMEYIDGNTFQKIVKKGGPMDPLRAAHYIRQAALGLQHAHEADLVHRDIKPSNLLLDRSGTVKGLDMGLARFFHDEADDLSKRHSESPIGTMDYMAPEQALDSHQVDIRADIYSLGATFYFLLAGRSPFQGGTTLQKLMRHQFERPRPIKEVRPEVHEELAAILDRMMAKEPAERYQTPAEVSDALAPWTRTPIPPPPPEEMPRLLAPARISPEGPASPGLPASLYNDAPPAPATGRELETVPRDPSPSQPILAGGSHATRAADAGIRLKADAPREPASSPPVDSGGSSATTHPTSSLPEKALGEKRRLPPIVLAAAAVLVLVACGAGFAIYKMIAAKGPTDSGTGGTPVSAVQTGETPTPSRLRLLVPAYIYPADEGMTQWERILDSPVAAMTVAILNTSSGPGKAADPNYVKVVEQAKPKGVTAIGYVSTQYARRHLDEVKGDVDKWVRFYPGIQGIFFDEQASSADQVPYYASLYEYVRKERGLSLVVTNPGALCAEEYVSRPVADVVCLVEVTKDFDSYKPPAWTNRYPAERFAALICKTDTLEQMEKHVLEMREKKIGYCFITDGDQPNPWGRLPRYWSAEVEAVRRANQAP
jgi:serine/threonine protein kinase